MAEKVTEYPVVWLQAATCTGCSVSVLNSFSPGIKNLLIDEIIPGSHLNLKFHATVMAGQGDLVIEAMEEVQKEKLGRYLLVVEGAIPTAEDGVYGAIGEKNGVPLKMTDMVESLGSDALAVVALGTCASFGGIPAGSPNPTNAMGVREFFEEKGITTPLINIPGCPPHPDWFVNTVVHVLIAGLPGASALDEHLRPKTFYGRLIHENCPRRAYFDEGKFAKKLGDEECMFEMGCKGPVTSADCPLRQWNSAVNWCIGNNSPCMGCVEPTFPDMLSPLYEKITDLEIPKIG